MLPNFLLQAAKDQPVLVELKNGETLNGQLLNCDQWMNLTLRDVVQLGVDGDSFFKVAETYVRGAHIKYLRLPDNVMDQARDANLQHQERRRQERRGNERGGRGGRGGQRDGGRGPRGGRGGLRDGARGGQRDGDRRDRW